jgi:hypothetical protein
MTCPIKPSVTCVKIQVRPIVLRRCVKGAKNPEASKRIIDFLASEKATRLTSCSGIGRHTENAATGTHNTTQQALV